MSSHKFYVLFVAIALAGIFQPGFVVAAKQDLPKVDASLYAATPTPLQPAECGQCHVVQYGDLKNSEIGWDGFISYTFDKDWRVSLGYGQWESNKTGTYTAANYSGPFGATAGFTDGTHQYDRIRLDHDIKPLEFKVYYLFPR